MIKRGKKNRLKNAQTHHQISLQNSKTDRRQGITDNLSITWSPPRPPAKQNFSITLKVIFEKDENMVVMVYPQQQHFANKKLVIPGDENTSILLNDRNTCVGIQT